MKGLSMPINIIVIIALAVIVLLGVSAFFMSGFGSGSGTMTHQNAWNTGCGQAKLRGGCNSSDTSLFESDGLSIQGYDPDNDGTEDDLQTACKNALGITTNQKTECQAACCG